MDAVRLGQGAFISNEVWARQRFLVCAENLYEEPRCSLLLPPPFLDQPFCLQQAIVQAFAAGLKELGINAYIDGHAASSVSTRP